MPVERTDWIDAVKKDPVAFLRKGYNGEVYQEPDIHKIVSTFECSYGTARKLGLIAVKAAVKAKTEGQNGEIAK